MVKIKKAGFLTKLVVLALLIAAATSLLDLRARLVSTQTQAEVLTNQIAQQARENAALSDAVENSGDPARMEAIARERLGLALPGEIIFYDISD